MVEKRFKAAFIAHVPDADSAKHRCVLKTSIYELTSVLVRDDEDAVNVIKGLAQKEGVRSFLLCPGFTHKTIARIADVVGEGVSLNVARGDAPSNQIALSIMNEVGWFKKR
jgi:hypothetical protein